MVTINEHLKNQSGQIIIISLVIVAILTIIAGSLLTYTGLQLRASRSALSHNQTLNLAEAGLDKALYELNQNPSYSGETDTALGNGTFSVSISSIDSNNKRITATGYIPSSASPTATTTVKATVGIDTSMVSFNFGVQVGPGGLNMNNNSQINGNVFSGGDVKGGGTITGDVTVSSGTTLTADQQWTTQNTDFAVGDISAHSDAAQGFVPSVTDKLNRVSLYLKKVGTPSDITVRVVSDNAGQPSKNVLTTGKITSSSITTNYNWIDASFNSKADLNVGQTYWILLDAAVSSSNYFYWGADNQSGYPSGSGQYSSRWDAGNPVWTGAGGDFNFQVFMGGIKNTLDSVTVNGNARAHTLKDCTIGGNGYYQSIDHCSIAGTAYPNSDDSPPQAMPISNGQIADWEADAAAGTIINGNQNINTTTTWGATKINGNLTVNSTLYLTGPVWVNGNISIKNNAAVRVDQSLGNNGAVLLADKTGGKDDDSDIDIDNNVILTGNNNPGSYLLVLSVGTGKAIDIHNNSNGAIFYSSQGQIDVHNNTTANQVTAYKLHLHNNVVVNYNSGLQHVTFANGPGGSWRYTPGSYVILK